MSLFPGMDGYLILLRERETFSEIEKGEGREWASGTAEALRSFNYEEWQSRARDV